MKSMGKLASRQRHGPTAHSARRQIARTQPGSDVREVSQPCDLDKAAVCDEPALAQSNTLDLRSPSSANRQT